MEHNWTMREEGSRGGGFLELANVSTMQQKGG